MISWGLRMALSGTLPVVWGLATGRLNDAIWITLTAEAISWVEMKGSFAWRARTLLMGAALCMAFGALGAVTGGNVWLSVVFILIATFFATLLKNIGDRASGLSICVYLLFIISNAYPTVGLNELQHRLALICIGAAWPVLVGVFISLLMPAKEPFRRQIALIWRAISALTATIPQGGDGRNHDLYLKEKEVRAAIDNSFQFYGTMAHQADKNDQPHYQLAQLRKAAGLVAVNIIAMGEEMEYLPAIGADDPLRIKTATLFNILQEAITRISVLVITLKPEEKLLAVSHINRLKKFAELIRQRPLPAEEQQATAVKSLLKHTGRTIGLLESVIKRIELMGKDLPVYRSYSFIKTVLVLKPKYLLRNIRVLFNFTTLTTRYAVRSAIAAAVALFIYKWFGIDYGYWLPFSVVIVIQPYFGATLKKALERIAGTVLGGLAGGLFLYLPVGLHLNEVILFLTFILMIYYIRTQYAIATFLVTLNLVLLLNIESAYSNTILVTRAICTVGGSLLAVVSGFALLPSWDRKWLPSHLAAAIQFNYAYFTATFFSATPLTNWTKYKRPAEGRSSDVFDSFNRYVEEPGHEKAEYYYGLITTNVRITRNLNNIHLEQEEKTAEQERTATPEQQKRINECLNHFNEVARHLPLLSPSIQVNITDYDPLFGSPFLLNEAQMVSLEKLIIELKTMIADLKQAGATGNEKAPLALSSL
jgi:hypothetical protein